MGLVKFSWRKMLLVNTCERREERVYSTAASFAQTLRSCTDAAHSGTAKCIC